MAMRDPKRFVLKPQREGGGNNVYDDEVRTKLQAIKDTDERTAYILMDRIFPPLQRNHMITAAQSGDVEFADYICELGIYGVIIGYKNNYTLGTLFIL